MMSRECTTTMDKNLTQGITEEIKDEMDILFLVLNSTLSTHSTQDHSLYESIVTPLRVEIQNLSLQVNQETHIHADPSVMLGGMLRGMEGGSGT